MALTKPPKNQIETYLTPPAGKTFKGTTHNAPIDRPFARTAKAPRTAMQPPIPGKGAKKWA